MKKAAALIITICLVLIAAAPVVVKAAADDLYYITYQANIGNQELVDRGIVQNTANGSVSYYMVNNQIDAYNDLQLPVDLSEWNYYMITGSNTWQGESFTSIAGISLVVYNSDSPLLCYKASPSLSQFYFDNASYKNGTYSWDRGTFTFYGENIKDLQENGDFKIFSLSGDNWSEPTYVFYNNSSIQVGGSFIASTNQPLLYAGEDIAKNSTVSVSNGYDLTQVKQWLADGVNNSESIIDYFQVTKDGVNYEGWDDAYGGETEFQQDNSLSLSSIDMVPLKDNFIGGMTATKVKGAFNFNTFDTTFGGDTVKENAAKSSYGLQFDVTVNYNVDCSYDKATFQALFGKSYSGSIHSTFYIDDMTEAEAQKFEIPVTLSDLLENADSVVTGNKQGLALLALINYAQEGERGSKTAEFLGFGGLTLQDDAIVSEVLSTVPLLGGVLDNIRDWISADYTYGLTELYYYADVTPYNSAVNIKGVMSDCECDLISGVHSGTAGGGYRTDPVTGEVVKDPDYKTGPDQNYLMPTILPGGGSGEIVVSGSPSNSSANAQGGVANVNVQANPIITFDNGLDTFMEVMNLSKNAETVQKGFWGFFGMFKDNPASELYREYFGDIPEDFMKFLLACSGICFGLGVFRFVRGRYL